MNLVNKPLMKLLNGLCRILSFFSVKEYDIPSWMFLDEICNIVVISFIKDFQSVLDRDRDSFLNRCLKCLWNWSHYYQTFTLGNMNHFKPKGLQDSCPIFKVTLKVHFLIKTKRQASLALN